MNCSFSSEVEACNYLVAEDRFVVSHQAGYLYAFRIKDTDLSVCIHKTGASIAFIDDRELALAIGDYSSAGCRSVLTTEAVKVADSELRTSFYRNCNYLPDSPLSFGSWIEKVREVALA